MFNKRVSTVLILTLVVIYVVSSIKVKPAIADDTWNDALLFYPFTTTVQENIRNITNTASFPLKVTVSYTSAENISRIKFYKLSANGTDFVQITDGIVVEYSDSYQPLNIGKTLVFTVYAKPSDTIMQNETTSVSVKIQAESVETGGGPWYPLVITPEIIGSLDTSPNVQLSFGQLITNRFNVHYIINITNKCLYSLNLTMRSWITSLNDYRVVYYSKNTSLLVGPKQSIVQTFDISIPIANSIFDVLGRLQTPYVLHVAFTYENINTEELLATINVDSSHALIQVVVIVGSVITLAVLVYFGLFRRRKKEGKETTEILTLQ
jgi:hypothetical protein